MTSEDYFCVTLEKHKGAPSATSPFNDTPILLTFIKSNTLFEAVFNMFQIM